MSTKSHSSLAGLGARGGRWTARSLPGLAPPDTSPSPSGGTEGSLSDVQAVSATRPALAASAGGAGVRSAGGLRLRRGGGALLERSRYPAHVRPRAPAAGVAGSADGGAVHGRAGPVPGPSAHRLAGTADPSGRGLRLGRSGAGGHV